MHKYLHKDLVDTRLLRPRIEIGTVGSRNARVNYNATLVVTYVLARHYILAAAGASLNPLTHFRDKRIFLYYRFGI